MTVKELIEILKEYPEDMKVCIGLDLCKIDCTVLQAGKYISDRVALEEPYLSLW